MREANDRGFEGLADLGRDRELFSGVQGRHAAHDRGPGRHRRLGDTLRDACTERRSRCRGAGVNTAVVRSRRGHRRDGPAARPRHSGWTIAPRSRPISGSRPAWRPRCSRFRSPTMTEPAALFVPGHCHLPCRRRLARCRTMMPLFEKTAAAIAREVAAGTTSATSVVRSALDRIATLDSSVWAPSRMSRASGRLPRRVRSRRGPRGRPWARRPGRCAIRGQEPLRSRRRHHRRGLEDQPRRLRRPRRDATLVERLEAAGAVCVGAVNMGEYAYDFTGENIHDGPSRNPHALDHMSGGSSGGSASAVAAGFVPLGALFGHQWFDPRAGVALRPLRSQADLWPPEPRPHLPVRGEPRPPGAAGPFGRGPGAVLRRHAGAGPR